MMKTSNGYCPEGECDCLEPCETTAEAFAEMMKTPIPVGEFDCCIPMSSGAGIEPVTCPTGWVARVHRCVPPEVPADLGKGSRWVCPECWTSFVVQASPWHAGELELLPEPDGAAS